MGIRTLQAIALVVGIISAAEARAQDWGDDQAPPDAAYAQPEDDAQVPVSGGEVSDVGAFEAQLAPYGQWLDLAVGHVWRPDPGIVGMDFRPYQTAGHWTYTEAGWAFVSDYDWGWAPFHYGRWWYDADYGWVWLPGTEWAPAWVDWRDGDGYVGWAPMAPPGFSFDVSTGWGTPWCFLPTQYMTEPQWYGYRLPPERTVEVYRATSVVPVTPLGGRMAYSRGPAVVHVSAAVGYPIAPVHVATIARAVPPPQAGIARPVFVARRPAPVEEAPSYGIRPSYSHPAPSFTRSQPYAPRPFAESARPYNYQRANTTSYVRQQPVYSNQGAFRPPARTYSQSAARRWGGR